jgi:hypothetical protein
MGGCKFICSVLILRQFKTGKDFYIPNFNLYLFSGKYILFGYQICIYIALHTCTPGHKVTSLPICVLHRTFFTIGKREHLELLAVTVSGKVCSQTLRECRAFTGQLPNLSLSPTSYTSEETALLPASPPFAFLGVFFPTVSLRSTEDICLIT